MCVRAQICNADVALFVPSVKQAPEEGMNNQPLAKLGLNAPSSALKEETGGKENCEIF